MAAVTELSFLLFALSNYIHATELIYIKKEGYSYTFKLPKNSTSCLISRCVGEEQLVLWNTSDLWSNSSSVPQHLKQRLVSSVKTSSYTILNLTHSDSGRYREECWTEGNVTHDNNFTITVCTTMDRRGITMNPTFVRLGGTVDLPCFGAADNLDIRWLKLDSRYGRTWNRVFGDKTTSVMDNVRGRYQVVTNTSALRVSNIKATDFTDYICLVMNQQQCVSSQPLMLRLQVETIYGSVGETAVLPCSITDSTDEQPPRWTKLFSTDLELHNQTVPSVDQNYSLVFSSLMLNHSGQYICKASMRYQHYHLYVCPKFGPPAVELFSEGEEVTLRCTDWRKDKGHVWFIKSNRTEGRIFSVESDQRMSRVSWYRDNGSLVISNISVGDAGEYWCVVYDDDYQCLSTERTVLVYMEPFGIYSTFFKVRCSVLSVLLG
ncbi:immunoglobulin superfamily member 10-like [Perca fluviatilis]|uniref:immunoglobulin superfamily member 10-like n=1 Tax=Perca fluviatilis TaxID=8168 RepID=UPI001965C930|nr:immunoglobulin superfamily member 10-like [Perca fluviatilis]